MMTRRICAVGNLTFEALRDRLPDLGLKTEDQGTLVIRDTHVNR